MKNQKGTIINGVLLSIFALPSVAYAQTIENLIISVGIWVEWIIPIVVGLSLLYFLWGVANFIRKSGDSGAREDAKQQMLWGIVALFVMVSVWGLVAFLQNSLGIKDNRSAESVISVPRIPQ